MRITTEAIVGIFVLAAIALFIYMGMHVGAWRFDSYKYHPYTVACADASGLSQQAEVRLAGVNVGWVDTIRLIDNGQYVRMDIMVQREYTLYANASAMIRQDGMLGTKFLELTPGDARHPVLKPGDTIAQRQEEAASMDTLMQQMGDVMSHVRDITQQMHQVVTDQASTQRFGETVSALQETSSHMASFVQHLDELVAHNRDQVVQTLDRVHSISETLNTDVPNMMRQAQSSLDQLSSTLDQDMRRITDNMAQTSESLDRVMHKIDSGEGVVGQLVADPVLANDLCTAMQGAREYFDAINRLVVIVDGHTESMTGDGLLSSTENAKGHVNARLHFVDDYFYLAGIAAVQGTGDAYIKDEETIRTYFDEQRNRLRTDKLDLDDRSKLQFAPFKREVERKFDRTMYNLQIGKMYDWLALRVGLFESAFGIAADFDVPLDHEHQFRWVTSLEAYDFNGRNRLTGHFYGGGQGQIEIDDRPHLKLLNKLFITPYVYFAFGADDFISKSNKNGFIGFGLRFADDNLKYLMSQVSF